MMGELNIKDVIISCLKNQLDCYRILSEFDKKLIKFDRKLFYLNKDQTKFDKELLEYYEKLENFENKLESNLIDYIDNYIEAYLKLERKRKEKIDKKRYNIKMLYFFFTSFFTLCIVYYTIINLF